MKILLSTVRFRIKYQLDNQSKSDIFLIDNFPANIISIKPIYYIDFIVKWEIDSKLQSFFEQLDLILQSHISLIEALDILSANYKNNIFEDIIYDMKLSINNGQDFHNNLDKYSDIIGSLPISMLSIGQKNGDIKSIIRSLSIILSTTNKNKNIFMDNMRYPLVLFSSLIMAIYIVFYSILPKLEHIFAKYGDNLPLSTKLLLNFKDFIDSYFIIISSVFIIAILYVTINYNYSKNFRYIVDKFIVTKIPFISKVILSLSLYRFFLILGQILKDKHNFQSSFLNALVVVENSYIKSILQNIYNDIQNGNNIYTTFKNSKLFDTLILSLINTALYTNRFDTVTPQISKIYLGNIINYTKSIKNKFVPIAIILVGITILWLFLSIFMPIWGLSRVLST
jgi:general secretion pathway protein F